MKDRVFDGIHGIKHLTHIHDCGCINIFKIDLCEIPAIFKHFR